MLFRSALTCAVQGPVVPSGHAALDAELPGGGWPTAELIDLLQPACAQHEWRLLLPVLQVLSLVEQGAQPTSPQKTPSRKRSRPQTPAHSAAPLVLVLVGAPHLPHLAALAALGVAPARLLRIDTPDNAERLWAAEQVLRSGTAGAVLVWLPHARPEQLRRLHLAARGVLGQAAAGVADQAGPLLLALRPEAMRQQASPAPLRLLLRSAPFESGLQVQVFKRRGPPMDQPITLAAELPVMACLRRHTAVVPAAVPLAARVAAAADAAPAASLLAPVLTALPAYVVDRPLALTDRSHARHFTPAPIPVRTTAQFATQAAV